jgi:DNA-binding transcriptional LysR family regulator
MSEVELRELRYFAAVAEELNFSRAAERLGMAQSPLSKAISQLESRLGVRLLERTTRQVTLTAAGSVLLEQATLVLAAAAAAITRTQRAGRAEPRLTVALKPGGDGGLLRDIIAAYQRPDLPPVETKVVTWGEPPALVRDGSADLALLRSPFTQHSLEIEELLSEPRVVALAADHPLASRTRLRRADLAGEPLPSWPDADAATTAYWAGCDPQSLAAAWPDSTPPALETSGPQVSDLAQLLEVVALGQAIAFLALSAAVRHPRTDIVYLPVIDLSPSIVAIAWPEGSRSRAVAAFVAAATQITARDPSALAALP